MNNQPNKTDAVSRPGKRLVWWLVLAVATGVIVYKLLPGVQTTRETALFDAPEESVADPMPPLEADLIPWQDDRSPLDQTSFTHSGGLGRVLIVRGILTIFSLGMDDLAKKMREAGYEVKVTTAAQSGYEARLLREHIIRIGSKKPVIIVGHSLGGDKAPGLARIFQEKEVPVDVLLMLDSTMPTAPPDNVKVCVNMYQDNGTPDWARVFRGTPIESKNSHTRMINLDVKRIADNDTNARINHFNIDANPWIHKVVIEMVNQLVNQAETEKSAEIQSNPIRNASQIPAHSPIDKRRRR